jgi:parallel beta-helix repeat protein
MEVKKLNVVFIIGILIACHMLSLFYIETGQAAGTTIYVDDSNTVGPWDGTQDYPYQTISEAITASGAMDTIIVLSGTYNEKLIISKDLIITGENKETTFVDGGGNGHVINAYGNFDNEIHVSIKNLTVRNAGGNGFDCITLSYIGSGEISNNKILNSQLGEGISIDHCHGLLIANNLITNNKVTGISVTASNDNILQNNIIQNNQKGIHLASFSISNQIISNTIRDNSIYGIYVIQSSNNVFTKNDFTDNNQNAQDGSTNSWSSNNEGNYWDDYNNYDTNKDGIGDVPYSIPGGDNIDPYPLGYFKEDQQQGGGNQVPVAVSLSFSKNPAMKNETITLSGEGIDTDGYITGYHWRSSLDGTLSTQQSFSTSTLSLGTHTIYFKVMDNDDAWSTEKTATLTINSAVNIAPIAYIDEITPNPAKQGQAVLFHGHGTDQDGTITAYKWLSSKDGVISTTASFLTTDLSRGTHTIYFQVKDNTEWSPQVITTLIIEYNASSGNPANQSITADAGGPYTGKVNESIMFNGFKSYTDGGVLTGYWDFGDNTSGTGLTPTHIYTLPGTYTITLTVSNEEGDNSSASTSVIISQSNSQSEGWEGFSLFDGEIPFPILLIIFFLVILCFFIVLIIKLKRR